MAFGGGGGWRWRRHVRRAAGRPGAPGAPACPSAGIPSELQAGVDQLLADEPEHGEPDVVFTPAAERRASGGG